jgi:disulfide bond formation protein DsbB
MNPVTLVYPPTLTGRALLILLAIVATLAIVWSFQAFGYEPCELCLAERYAFYAGVPLGALTAWAASDERPGLARAGLALLALLFLANAGFAFYHVGVERHWWQGPTACTGSLSGAVDVNDLMKQLNTAHVARCDEVALRILGLSLAGWDVIASAALAAYAGLAARLSR